MNGLKNSPGNDHFRVNNHGGDIFQNANNHG